MPTYEYACIDCGTHIEVFQRISDDPLTTCGACGGRLRKVFHPAGILFKGSGFYRTDNRSSKPASEKAAPDGGGGGDSKKAASGSTERSGSPAGKPGGAAKGKSA
jgi:putative FmdB family regulatory protein